MRSTLTKAAILTMIATGVTLASGAQAQASSGGAKTVAASKWLSMQPVEQSSTVTRLGFFSTVRKIVKCAASIGAFAITNYLFWSKLKKTGGVWKAAKRVLKAKGKNRKLKALASIFGEVAGLNAVAEACGA